MKKGGQQCRDLCVCVCGGGLGARKEETATNWRKGGGGEWNFLGKN